MASLTNDELIKMRSRIYRGYRAPVATTEFFNQEQLTSVVRDGSGNIQQTVHKVFLEDGSSALRTTDYVLDGTGNVQSSTETYTYETTNPTP
jgi:hypothetical protein